NVRKPSGDRNSMSTPSPLAVRASEVRVRTTPLTCGCHASVATKTRILVPSRPAIAGVFESVDDRVATGGLRSVTEYFNRVTARAADRWNRSHRGRAKRPVYARPAIWNRRRYEPGLSPTPCRKRRENELASL